MTTNYPTDHYYENDEDCKFEILSATPANSQLSITEFYLEDPSADFCAFDYLLIDGVRYCGVVGPQGVAVAAGDLPAPA